MKNIQFSLPRHTRCNTHYKLTSVLGQETSQHFAITIALSTCSVKIDVGESLQQKATTITGDGLLPLSMQRRNDVLSYYVWAAWLNSQLIIRTVLPVLTLLACTVPVAVPN